MQWMTDGFIVQIYEIQSPEEALEMIDLGVDHVGSVYIGPAAGTDHDIAGTVAAVRGTRKASSSLIPLLEDSDTVCRALERCRPDIVHFCENPVLPSGELHRVDTLMNRQRTVRRRFPEIRIMRSIPIAVSGSSLSVPSLELADRFAPFTDLFLTDTVLTPSATQEDGSQPVKGFVGITGRTCNWDTAALLVERGGLPVVLAGGLDPENVGGAIRHVRPAGVDSCTGTNARDGNGQVIRFKKDKERVRRFVEEARGAAAEECK
jgi:phosphoribosylanthranilate isomerase